MDKKHISINLKRLRLSQKLSQEQVADKAKLSRMAYYSVENGKSKPRIKNLEKIADALNATVSEIIMPPPKLSGVRFRSVSGCVEEQKKDREAVINDVGFWLEDVSFLEQSLEKDRSNAVSSFKYSKKYDPSAIAEKFRKHIGLKEDETINDICDLVESIGIRLYSVNMGDDKINGLSVKNTKYGYAIAVNDNQNITIERKIFTVAHELGHLVMHNSSFRNDLVIEDDNEESQANSFASYFLMPDKAFDKMWEYNKGNHLLDNVMHMKRIFKVSCQVVLCRLAEKGIHDAWPIFRYYFKLKYGKKFDMKKEPEPLLEYDFLRDGTKNLVKEAYQKGKISFNKAAQLLKLSACQMRELRKGWVDVR